MTAERLQLIMMSTAVVLVPVTAGNKLAPLILLSHFSHNAGIRLPYSNSLFEYGNNLRRGYHFLVDTQKNSLGNARSYTGRWN